MALSKNTHWFIRAYLKDGNVICPNLSWFQPTLVCRGVKTPPPTNFSWPQDGKPSNPTGLTQQEAVSDDIPFLNTWKTHFYYMASIKGTYLYTGHRKTDTHMMIDKRKSLLQTSMTGERKCQKHWRVQWGGFNFLENII